MAVVPINLRSQRAFNARFAQWFGKIWIVLLQLLVFILLFTALAMLTVGSSWGWFVGSLAAIPTMILSWAKGELKSLPPIANGNRLDDFLTADILAYLDDRMTTRKLASIATKTGAGRFMAVRFGLTANFMQNITTDDPRAVDDVWQVALQIKQKMGLPMIDGTVVVAALVYVCPMKDNFLAVMKIDYDDLLEGVKWYNYLIELINKAKKPVRTGGIARDWSFGYTPLLKRFAVNLSLNRSRSFELSRSSEIVDQMLKILGGNGRKNVALVGPTGVGKTEIVRAFSERLIDANADIPKNLKFRQVFLLDSASLISAAPGRGELEGLVMRILVEAYNAKNIILCLDDAQLFFQEGVGAVDLTNVLQPILDAGNVSIILTMDEQNLLQIGQKNSGLMNSLNRINVTEASETETLELLEDYVVQSEYRNDVTYMFQALREAYRLSQRYVYDLAMPGRAIKLVESAAQYSESGFVTMNSVQQAIEKTVGVKVSVASNQDERDVLLNLEDRIHERMINQVRAVKVVSDALRRARVGVRNESRPIGTFLFLGPTGVGKTELSKALADVYFGGENNLVRIDLNEYVGIDDVKRLIEDGAVNSNSLTAQVMKNPFSVILLDEIEKAHPNVLTALLQLLDEGILRDVRNREVSFRDSIVIATSNAGADTIRHNIENGEKVEEFESSIIDSIIESGQFKPEFLNRFDEIVLFTPLTKPDLIKVIDLILKGVNKTLSTQKVSVMVDDEAKQYLVDVGYDPRLGARPMRRIVQRAVENTVAKEILSGNVAPGGVIMIDRNKVEAALSGGGQ